MVPGWVLKTTLVAAPKVRVNELLGAGVSGDEVAESVKLPMVPTMEQPLAVATPELAVKVSPLVPVPEQVRVPVPEAMPKMTAAELLVTVLPPESSTLTTGWGFNAAPLTALVVPGWVLKTTWVAEPKVRVNERSEARGVGKGGGSG